MAMIVLLSAKGAPGVTTSVAALASAWPAGVVVVDADPDGGDLAPGWLGQWLVDGRLRGDRGVLSFATATRHTPQPGPAALAEHLQTVPTVPQARILVGLQGFAQARSVGEAGWQRLAHALAATSTGTPPGPGRDVLVDVGRFSASTPWPLLIAADLVLAVVRPTQRHVLAARPVADALRQRLDLTRLGLAVVATTGAGTRQAQRVLGMGLGLDLPADPAAAVVFSDGHRSGAPPTRSALMRTARRTAAHLHTAVHTPAPEPSRSPEERTPNTARVVGSSR